MSIPEPTYPRSVTPGIETHERVELEDGTIAESGSQLPPPGLYVGLDWIRCTGPDQLVQKLQRALSVLCDSDPKSCHGAKWFKMGAIWEPGVLLSWQHQNEICQVDIQGQRLQLMDGRARIDLLRSLVNEGMKPTRIDGALDFVDQNLEICIDAKNSCERGELCILRKFSPNDEFTAQGIPTRRLLKLGSRSSPVCGRIYDKGLEQGIAPAGWYERMEIEWKSDRASQVCTSLLNAGDEWPDTLVSFILGAVEFREVTGRSELHRRPFAAWWRNLISNRQPVRIPRACVDASFEKWSAWARSAIWPRVLELALAVGVPVPEVVTALCQGIKPSRRGGPIVEQFRIRFEKIEQQ